MRRRFLSREFYERSKDRWADRVAHVAAPRELAVGVGGRGRVWVTDGGAG
ncbi:hypothetical protein GCM10025789_10910 [Tessaracoccus lubricantis]|uniref:Uncharacterized protein n=1 Tax=Tessaracoccus lubricantis TaxID=545543 RepID=A0ABP9F6J9_9ACTN